MGRTAVLAHGAGSTADLVRRAFEDPLAAAGVELVTFDDRTGDVAALTERLGSLVDGCSAGLVGGISLGAHAAVRVAATRPGLEGLLAALPAWTGPPGPVAALSGQAAAEIEAAGLPSVLARLRGQGWVGRELALAWPTYGQEGLIRCLRATAASAGPGEEELRSVTVPTGIVAVVDDPYHPSAIARRWGELIPSAVVTVLHPEAVGEDRGALGRACVDAWLAAQGSNR